MNETLLSGAPMFLGVLMLVATALKWPRWLDYIFAAIVFAFGFLVKMMM